MKSLKDLSPTLIAGAGFALVMLLIGSMIFQKSCGGGYESPEYFKLKGQFEAYKATAEQKEEDRLALEAKKEEENTALLEKIDKLEIEKGEILIESAERNKKIFEKDMELEDLKEKEESMEGLSWDLVANLRAQNVALQGKFTLAIEDRDKFRSALNKANFQIIDLKTIIANKDLIIDGPDGLRVELAAKDLALKIAEETMAVGEKNNFVLKALRFVGNGFKIYGAYAAGRDILKGAKS